MELEWLVEFADADCDLTDELELLAPCKELDEPVCMCVCTVCHVCMFVCIMLCVCVETV